MKKVFKIRSLRRFLIALLFGLPLLICLNTYSAVSNTYKSNIPIKRPNNLFKFQESADTILNMIQKVGAMPTVNVKKTHLKKNETLSTALLRVNFNTLDINKIINSIYKVKNGKKVLSSLPVGMIIDYSNPSKLIGGALKFNFSKTKDIFVWQDFNGNFISQIFLRPTKLERNFVKGKIKSSLYVSALNSGMPKNTLLNMVTLLGFSVDFQREIRQGDTFEVLFTKQIDILNNMVIGTSPITFVSITLSGQKLNYFNYKDEYGFPQYYDENGKSSKRTIMKTPINGARLTSRYGNRKHPVLGYTKMHRGLDFAAPSGTPVFAAGDGIIETAGWKGSYGRYIKIRHSGTYKTAYAHLSKIHKNVRVGKRVFQGKTIGYVGTSGRSTGPHLHYEVLKNNSQINPMNIKLPSGKNIPQKKLKSFKNYVKTIISEKIALEKGNQNDKFASNSKKILDKKKLN